MDGAGRKGCWAGAQCNRPTHENHSRAMTMPRLAGGMSREARIIRMVTMLELGTPGVASDPTDASTLNNTRPFY